MEAPYPLSRRVFEELRGPRGLEAVFAELWCAGDPAGLTRPSVAIVGTRAATPYGRRLARTFAAALGEAGCCIVSGLALGIDGAAHEGALDAAAPTVAILGGGHARLFPRRHAPLAERIVASGGAVLSPFPPEQPAQPWQFLARNGIVAALADALLVVEAPARSGALNTASWAAGRIPVLAIPGDVDRPHVAGCHALIRDGAILARAPEDVLEVLGLPPPSAPTPAPVRPKPLDDPTARAVLARLHDGERSVEELIAATGAGAGELLAALAGLELRGAVESRGGGRYATVERR